LPFKVERSGTASRFLGLLAGQPVPQPGSLLPDVGDVGQAGRLLLADHAVAAGLADHLADGREPDISSGGRERLHADPPLHQERPGERSAGRKGEEVVEGFGVVAPGVGRGYRVEDQFPQQSLSRSEGQGLPSLLSAPGAAKTSESVMELYYP
jgi:hypothetical protein